MRRTCHQSVSGKLLRQAPLLFLAYLAVTGWLLPHAPTEAERTQILTNWQNVAVGAFAFWFCPSVGASARRRWRETVSDTLL